MELLQYDVGRSGRLWSVFIHVASSYAYIRRVQHPRRQRGFRFIVLGHQDGGPDVIRNEDDHNRLETAEVYKYICWFPRPSRSCQLSKKSTRLYTARLRDRRSAHVTEKTIMEKPYLIIRCKNGIVRCCVYPFYVEVLIFGSQLHCQRLNFKHWHHWHHTIRRWIVTVYSNCSTSERLTKRRCWPDIKKTRAVNILEITVCLQNLFMTSSAALMAPYVILLKPTTLVTLVGTVVMFSALPMLVFAS